MRGEPVPILEGVRRSSSPVFQGFASFAFSDGGSLVYLPGGAQSSSESTVVALADRNGKIQPLGLPLQSYVHPRISPDGTQLALGTDDGIIWIYDLQGNRPPRRLTFEGRNFFPIWTPDARFVTFQSDREGDLAVFRQAADGSSPAERLTKPETGIAHEPESWSPDGRTLSINRFENVEQGIWTVSFGGEERKPEALIDMSNTVEKHSVFSPDGKWMAYMSTELGASSRVFVQPFPPTGTKYQISAGQGRTPLWSPDGRQLFYHIAATNELVAVDIQTTPVFTVGKPTPLPIEGTVHPQSQRNYDITPDGQQFVVILPADTSSLQPKSTLESPRQINLVLNWFSELKQLVPLN